MEGIGRIALRAKLLLLSAAVLALPYMGLEYLRGMERYLRDALEVSLMDAARAVAGPLHDHGDLFPPGNTGNGATLYVHNLNHPMQVDGYTDDWQTYIGWSDTYSPPGKPDSPDLSFKFIVSRYEPYYFALLQVRDNHLVYQRPQTPVAVDNDHVVLVFDDRSGKLQQLYFSPSAPGEMRPFRYRVQEDEYGFQSKVAEYVNNITGQWQPVEGGYNLELAIPTAMVANRMGLVVDDVDDAATRKLHMSLGTAGAGTLNDPGRIVQPSPAIIKMIERFRQVAGRRLWVLDGNGQVLASAGSLEKPSAGSPVSLFYRAILPPIHERFQDDLAGASRLQGQEVKDALHGATGTRWRSSPDGKAIIVSAATPVYDGNSVRGAVVVEETTGGIQMLQRRAMISLFNKTFLAFFLVTAAVLGFATRISYRLRKLSRNADAAIDEHGRVIGNFAPGRSSDEIGDLSRRFAAMFERLRQYTGYLEKLAGRLSHELRTPITVVRSSLEHLQPGDNAEQSGAYLERARAGVERLDLLVSRLSEASRLEQALQHAQMEDTDIGEFVSRCVAGYRLAYPGVEFVLYGPRRGVVYSVGRDLLEQMLDKLVGNAVDFHRPGTPVELGVQSGDGTWILWVANRGPGLPDAMQEQLFSSMVSVRPDQGAGARPHLGLGLYIVRLIADFHRARARAFNLPDGDGVRFELEFPEV